MKRVRLYKGSEKPCFLGQCVTDRKGDANMVYGQKYWAIPLNHLIKTMPLMLFFWSWPGKLVSSFSEGKL